MVNKCSRPHSTNTSTNPFPQHASSLEPPTLLQPSTEHANPIPTSLLCPTGTEKPNTTPCMAAQSPTLSSPDGHPSGATTAPSQCTKTRRARDGGKRSEHPTPSHNAVHRNFKPSRSQNYVVPGNRGQEICLQVSNGAIQVLPDIRPPLNEAIGNFTMVLSPSVRGNTVPPPMSQFNANLTQHYPSMNKYTSFVIWNIRGGHNDDFKCNFRDLLNTYKPCMVALLETRMTNHITLRVEFHFSNMVEVPAQCQSGGIAILWQDNNVHLNHI